MHLFMITLFLCSVTMSVLGLLYMAMTPFLAKRYSVMGRYYAWLICVVGLIIPFRPQFGHGIVKVTMPNRTLTSIQISSMPPAAVTATNTLHNISWWQAAAIVWLAGMLLFFVYHGIKHHRFLRLTAHWSENITEEQTLTLFQGLKEQMGLTKNIGLQFCDSIGSPMMIGYVKPRILLPRVSFARDELCFILRHELVHYKRKDLWYKALVLLATGMHWFNPIVYFMARDIQIQCELSCDEEVVKGESSETRLFYSEIIIGVVRYQSKLKTAFSTNFYGGKKGMKKRIFSIMDMSKKKAGASIFCSVLILTLGTGLTFAANAEAQVPPEIIKENIVTSVAFVPNPDIYDAYAAFDVTISEDGTRLLYKGQPVRLFADEYSATEAFYLDESGQVNLSVVRNDAGEITRLEGITAQKAQEYEAAFFSDTLSAVQNNDTIGLNKYDQYKPFGITYSTAEGLLSFHGQRVRFLADQYEDRWFDTLWLDEGGTANLVVNRDSAGEILGLESISDEKAQQYQAMSEKFQQRALDGLEEKVENKVKELFPES